MNDFDALDRAVTSTGGVVKGVTPAQLDAPTPCRDWTVRDVLNHVVGTLWLAEALFADKDGSGQAAAPGGLPATDIVGDDPAAAYAEAANAALSSAAIEGALTAVHPTPMGDMPGPVLAGFTALDLFVHGWDVARATGQPTTDLDAGLAEHVLAFARHAFADGSRRNGLVDPEIALAGDAPVVDRLVAYLGRQP